MSEIIELLKDANALLTDDHFIYTSGKHGSVYINKDALYPHTRLASRVGELFALNHQLLPIDAVVGPALGGIILSQWTAYHLSQITARQILSIYTEKDADGKQTFTRGYDQLINAKNILIVEDIINTGGSIKQLIDLIPGYQGNILAATAMVNRSPEHVNADTLGVSFTTLGELPAVAYEPDDCPLCKQNLPINTSVGHGKKHKPQ